MENNMKVGGRTENNTEKVFIEKTVATDVVSGKMVKGLNG